MSVAAELGPHPGRPLPLASAPAFGTGPQPRFRSATSPFSGEAGTAASSPARSRALLGQPPRGENLAGFSGGPSPAAYSVLAPACPLFPPRCGLNSGLGWSPGSSQGLLFLDPTLSYPPELL